MSVKALSALVPPSMTTAQRSAIPAGNRPPGATIFNTTTGKTEVNIGSDASPNWMGVPLDWNQVVCSSTVTFTTTVVDVPGCTWTPTVGGVYLVVGAFDMYFPANTGGDVGSGLLSVNGVVQAVRAQGKDVNAASATRWMATQVWIVSIGAGQVLKLQAVRPGTTGTAQILNGYTTMTAIRIG